MKLELSKVVRAHSDGKTRSIEMLSSRRLEIGIEDLNSFLRESPSPVNCENYNYSLVIGPYCRTYKDYEAALQDFNMFKELKHVDK